MVGGVVSEDVIVTKDSFLAITIFPGSMFPSESYPAAIESVVKSTEEFTPVAKA